MANTRPMSHFTTNDSHFLRTSHPFYYSTKPALFPGLTDHELALVLPVIAYWGFSLIFHLLDCSNLQWLEKHRIHESIEIRKRNIASKRQVIFTVLSHQFLQTFLGWIFIDDVVNCGGSIAKHLGAMQALVPTLQRLVHFVFGSKFGSYVWDQTAEGIVYYAYWWGIPTLQFVFALCVCVAFSGLGTDRVLEGSSWIHGDTVFTGSCTATNFSTNTFILYTIGYMCRTLTARSTATL
jgi:sphinganine C4-monooxygenase